MLTKLLRAAGAMVLAAALVSCSDGNMLAPTPGELRLTTASTGGVVISQVYGGGGNSGATYKNDFIELFNSSASPISVDGWSVQYASSGGTTWARTALSGTIPAGGYYLVQQAAGTGGTVDLPAPNASGTLAMSGTAGKVALVSNNTSLAGSCPTTGVIDLVGYGAANCSEGNSPTATLSNTTAAIRLGDGCKDTDVNSADFATGAPAPRNSASATKSCETVPVRPVVTVTIAPTEAAITVGTQQELVATGKDDSGNTVSGTTFTWTTSNAAVATVSAAGVVTAVAPGTATITATTPNNVAGSATITVSAASGSASNVRVSEFHYDNDGTDVGESIEVEGDANGSLAGWSLVLYSGSTGSSSQGQSYGTIALTGTFPVSCGTRGVLVFAAPGLQNGDKDGFALVNAAGAVVEFLSYEGSFTATNGPAAGMTSTDVGVAQASTTPTGRSLQRAGNGTWFGPSTATFGACNPATPPLPQTGISFSGRHPTTDPALPVGFQDQLFATLRDAGTGATIPTVFAWSSETPGIATIDQDGVITAVAAGTAVFRATATDGTTNTYSLPMHVATASQTAQYGHNTEFGEPTDGDASDDHILRYSQFTSSFNRNRNTPNWVSYNIDATHFGAEDRCDCFTYDTALPADFPSYTTAAYTGAGAFHGYGIDRGHLARSFDRTAASLDNAHTYYFSNIIPQAADNNQGPWALMENYLGDLARRDNKEVFVIAGVAGSKGTLKNEGRVVIPAQTWKVALVMNRDQGLANVGSHNDIEVIAVIMPNDAGIRNVPWATYKTTVDAVEAISGYDLLAALPDHIERLVESGTRAPTARTDGPYVGAEGSPIFLNGNASSDPDGDALTFAWEFGDGTTGTGATPSHTYADNGTYQVKLTVTDVYGAESSTTTQVVVANVDPSVHVFAGATIFAGESFNGSTTFTDAGADQWTATVDYGDGSGVQPLAISGNGMVLSHRYATAGTYTVTVTVRDDDGGVGTQTATVTVQDAGQGIAGLQTLVSTLERTGSLSQGNANALLATLRAAAASLARGNETSAVNQLEAFVNQVNAMVRSDRLTQAQADAMTAAAGRIIRSIQL